jgi:RNA polymerase sigma-70 factor (ECF subfamily)
MEEGIIAQSRPSFDDDYRLLQHFQAGDREAFDALFRRHVASVYQRAVRLLDRAEEAEEVVQEVFLALYEKAQTFRGEAALSTWLYRLTTNAAISKLRQRQRRVEISLEDYLPRFQEDGHHEVRPVIDWSLTCEERLANAEQQQILHQAIAQLSALDKAVVVLSDLEELSNQEIGETLGLTVAAVKARLHRARLVLRAKLTVVLQDLPS